MKNKEYSKTKITDEQLREVYQEIGMLICALMALEEISSALDCLNNDIEEMKNDEQN